MTDLLSSLSWYLASVAAGLLALPLAYQLFRRLPDRGYTLAKPLGLLLICYVFWLLGSLGFLRNDVPGLLLSAGIVGALGLAWLGRPGFSAMRAWLRQQRGFVLGVEVVYLLAFAALVYVRAYNPEILHTEKPMEYMFINAILRSDTFPPQDAWLSGHAISYYHFGYVIIAALTRLTATASEVAFNLGLALLFALTAVGSLGIVVNLIALSQPAADGPRRLQRAFWPALLGPLFVLVVGNFYGVVQTAYLNGMFAETRIPAVRYYFGADDPANAMNPPPADPGDTTDQPGVRAEMVNLWDWLDLKLAQRPLPPPPDRFRWDTGGNWFFAARVVHDRDLLGSEREAIDENPAFSFVLGDMHPHVLALPFVVLATALALDWLLWAWGAGASGWLAPVPIAAPTRTPSQSLPAQASSEDEATEHANGAPGAGDGPSADRTAPAELQPSVREGVRLRLALVAAVSTASLRGETLPRLLLTGLVLGGLSYLNTWDFPIYLFLTVLATALGLGLRVGWPRLVGALPRLALLAVGLAVLSVALYFPFYLVFQSQAGGVLPNLIWPTRFQQSFVFFGPVMICVALYLGWLAYRGRAWLDRRAGLWAGLGLVGVLVLAVVVLAAGASFNASLGAMVDQFIAPLSRQQALTLAVQRRLVDSAATLFPAALIGIAAALAVGVMRRVPKPAPAVAALAHEPLAEVEAPLSVPAMPGVVLAAAPPDRPWRRQTRAVRAARPAGQGAGSMDGGPLAGLDAASPAVLMALAMAVTGALLMLGPEYLYLRDNFGFRMNTLFKFYFQTWTLLALVTAFGVWHIARAAGPAMRAVTVAIVSLAAVGGLMYTLPALHSRANGFRGPATLDGMAYFARDYPDDWAAIQWLRQNADGAPVVAEAVGASYQVEEGRISMATGLPTLMGWTGHEGQWRGQYYSQVAERPEALSTLYQVRDWPATQAILDRYDIEYVVVGQTERRKYNPVYLPKFEQNMDLVFESGDVLIYQRKPLQAP